MQTPQISINITHIHPYTPTAPQTLSRHIQTTKEANTYKQTSADVNRRFQPSSNNTWGGLGMSLGSVCWCCLFLLTSINAWIVSGVCFGVLDCIWMVSMDVYGVWMCLRGYLGAHPLQSWEFTPFWHSPESCYFLHLSILRHQNIKMSRYILNKNGWVLPFFSCFESVTEKLKNTVTRITL